MQNLRKNNSLYLSATLVFDFLGSFPLFVIQISAENPLPASRIA